MRAQRSPFGPECEYEHSIRATFFLVNNRISLYLKYSTKGESLGIHLHDGRAVLLQTERSESKIVIG